MVFVRMIIVIVVSCHTHTHNATCNNHEIANASANDLAKADDHERE